MSGFISDEIRTARKEHKCFLCGEKILKGEKYRRSVFFEDGMNTISEHKRCYDMIGDLDSAFLLDSGEYTSDEFQEAVNELCRAEICPMCPKYDRKYEGCAEDKIPSWDCMQRVWHWAKAHYYNIKTRKWESLNV